MKLTVGLITALLICNHAAIAQDADEISKQLANPIGDLVSVPFQNNLDFGGGPNGDGYRYQLNIQPVIPHEVNEDWNMVHRVIFPLIDQEDMFAPEVGGQSGTGDTVYSQWLSPKQPGENGLIWGAGLAYLIPTANDDLLGLDQWGVGPTAVALNTSGPWMYGFLWNHIWKVAGESDRPGFNGTFLQPFLVKNIPGGTSVALNSEMTYDWNESQFTLPVNLMYNQVFNVWEQVMQWQVGARYYLEGSDTDPDWGLRFSLIFVYPK